jgi:hypothetical protein
MAMQTGVQIMEIVSSVRTMDASALLSPRTLEAIVEAVLAAVREAREHESRAAEERRIRGSGGERG